MADVDVEAEHFPPPLESLAHVAVQRPQGRDVQRSEAEALAALGQRVQDRQHRRLRLAGPGRGHDERVLATDQRRNRPLLWLGRCLEPALGESLADCVSQRSERRCPLGDPVGHRYEVAAATG